jgi:PAS domain S-box-containing protein
MGVHHPDASLSWISISSMPLCSAQGAPPYAVVTTFHDITVLKQAADSHKQSEAQIALSLQGASEGFWKWDIQADVMSFNESWASLIGYEPRELEPTLAGWQKRLHPDDLERATASVQACLSGKTDLFDSEDRLRHKDGRWIWMHSRGRVMERDPSGKAISAAGTSSNIDSRKSGEGALLATLAENEVRVGELKVALAQVTRLSGQLSTCAYCKRVKADDGWQQIESYISAHSELLFSHGLCPECRQTHFPKKAPAPSEEP